DAMDPAGNSVLRFIRRVVPLTPDASSGRFVVASDRRWVVTPLGLALVALAVADLTFAVDSVSAAFGITTDFLVLWVANAVALAGRGRSASMSASTVVALLPAAVSTTLTNLAYLRKHDAAAELPVLCMRRPLQSARLLLENRSWLLGFAIFAQDIRPLFRDRD